MIQKRVLNLRFLNSNVRVYDHENAHSGARVFREGSARRTLPLGPSGHVDLCTRYNVQLALQALIH